MKVNRTTTIEMTNEDIIKAITEYLKNKEVISDMAKVDIQFNVSKRIEDEDLFSPGYEILEFNGCKVLIK